MPTEVTETINPNGGTYSNLAQWEAATDNLDLVSADEIRIALITTNLVDNTINVVTDIPVTDTNRYRVIRGNIRYNPSDDTGIKILLRSNTTQSLRVRTEQHFHFENFGVIDNRTNGGSAIRISLGADNAVVDGVYVRAQGTGVTSSPCFETEETTATNNTFRNCIADRNNALTAGQGGDGGFTILGFARIQNCVSYFARLSGFDLGSASAGSVVENCIGIDNAQSTGFDFVYSASPVTSNNCSGDASADDGGGTGHLTNQTAAGVWTNATNHDFRLTTASPCEDAGVDLSAFFTVDFAGNTHNLDGSGWAMGAYDSGSQSVAATNFASWTGIG